MNKDLLYNVNRFFMWVNLGLALILALAGDISFLLNFGVALFCWFVTRPKESDEL